MQPAAVDEEENDGGEKADEDVENETGRKGGAHALLVELLEGKIHRE